MSEAPAVAVLGKLLARAERARIRGEDGHVSLPATSSSMPEYARLRGSHQLDPFFAEIRQAERAGAVRIAWDEDAGVGNAISRLTVVDADRLAHHLGVVPHWELLSHAQRVLQADRAQYPRVTQFLDPWSRGKTCRGVGPGDVDRVIDAIAVLRARQGQMDSEVTQRELSVALFSNSKRLAQLAAVLDELMGDEGGDQDDVFERLGIVRFPQPVLIAGPLMSPWGDALVQPYVGLAPEAVSACRVTPSVWGILTVENLTTFNVLARDRSRPEGLMVVYTAGNPTPGFLNAYQHLLTTAPAPLRVLHWGDIDLGGFRIAYRLHQAAVRSGYCLSPLHMDVSQVPCPRDLAYEALPSAKVTRICDLCDRMGWDDLGEALRATPLAIEQEGLTVNWALVAGQS